MTYSSVSRTSGVPTGIPSGAQLARVTVNDYYKETPDSSNTTTDDADAYHKSQTDYLLRAVKSSEVRSSTSSSTALARTEFTYDGSATTGNVTAQASWDSTKGSISRPLTSGNWISTSNSYSTWCSGATGKLTSTTDAKGNVATYTYSDLNGTCTAIYPTETVAASSTSISRTTDTSYEFYTGKVTQVKDMDNNIVLAKTTYDLYARPTLVEEGGTGSTPTFLRQTATTYSDTLRRVIVQADKTTKGDGKLVSIQHYDQLGRVRLTRTLESPSQDPTAEADGIKVQTRYFAGTTSGSPSYPNAYEVVSAPYHADYSYNAGSEPGMGWKRSKHDLGGKLIELQTFVGYSLPAPWGSNTSGSGTIATAYDTEFTTVTDQASKVRRSMVDGLGRLARVDEPNSSGSLGTTSSPNQATSYLYNALGNLTEVDQGSQTRTFSYSSLGRLTSATNPESGTVSYQYDDNGNLTQKTDARSTSISYTYDALNRNLTVDNSRQGQALADLCGWAGDREHGRGVLRDH